MEIEDEIISYKINEDIHKGPKIIENSELSKDKNLINPSCICKGIRHCEICKEIKSEILAKKQEMVKNIEYIDLFPIKKKISDNIFSFELERKESENFNIEAFNGFFVINNVMNDYEYQEIMREVNTYEWVNSQSGRKKQDFGVKINYKKKKIKSEFKDIIFPSYKKIIEEKTNSILLEINKFYKGDKELGDKLGNFNNFIIHEIGNLLYSKHLGAHIEPHIDDVWIWGDRIIGFNLLGSAEMTFSYLKEIQTDKKIKYEINIPIKPNQLYIMCGNARNKWFHEVKANSILSDRIVITCREFCPNIEIL